MTDKPIIQADFVKPQPVPSRKVLQLVFEVPEEAADHAMAVLGGFPQSGENRWCAIARLTGKPAVAEPPATTVEAKPKGGPLAKRAGILCNNPSFQNWFHTCAEGDWEVGVNRPEYTARTLRVELHIDSRADLDHNQEAAAIFEQIERDYHDSQHGWPPEAQSEEGR